MTGISTGAVARQTVWQVEIGGGRRGTELYAVFVVSLHTLLLWSTRVVLTVGEACEGEVMKETYENADPFALPTCTSG